MSIYKKEVNELIKDTGWTFFKGFPLFVIIVCLISLLGFALHSAGLFGHTVVERTVFENSYQRSEGIKARIATDRATVAEIEQKITNPNLDSDTRYNLEAQLSAARIRISTAKEMQR